MPTADRLAFAPPPPPGMLRAFALAIAVHLLLMLALTWGVNWKRDSEEATAEAELWSATPQRAAPPPAQTAPPQPAVKAEAAVAPPPVPTPAPPPTPKAAVRPAPVPPPVPSVRDADIALERDKKKKAEARERQEDAERVDKLAAQKAAEAQKKLEAAKKQELASKAAESRKAAEAAKAVKTEQEARKAEDARRQSAISRAMGQAGDSDGEAARASGPSASYGGRIRAKVRPNITFNDDIAGNPTAEVEVRVAPDGTITSKRIVKSSGVRSWDEAVLRALDKTETLPRDVDGRVHTPMVIEFKPKG